MTPAATPASFSLGLLCTYKQYKADTETIAGWLKATAVKHGYKFDGQNGWTIRTSDFVPMAKQIVANVKQTPFTLQPAIHRAFRRAIVARNECTVWYEQNTEGQCKSNEKHAYFTDILMTAWDILLSAAATEEAGSSPKSAAQQLIRKEARPKAQTVISEINAAVSSNRFAAFYIDAGGDDDDDEELDVAGTESPMLTGTSKKGKKSKSSYTALPTTIIPDEGQIEEEFWFAIQSFLQEQQKVRKEVGRYWEDYRSDESHLIMATFGTRMAIDLIRRSESEMDLQVKRPARFPAHKYPVSTFPALLVAAKQQGEGSVSHNGQPFDAPLDGFVLISSRQNDLTLYNTYSTIKLWSYHRRKIPGFVISQGLSLNEEVSRLNIKVSKINGLVDYRPPYEDDITRGVKKALQCGEIPLWTTFAMRLLLDMEDILDGCRILPWMDVSEHTLSHVRKPPTHWHHEFGRHHIPLSDEPLDQDFLRENFVKHKPSLVSEPVSMLEKIRTSEGPRKKGVAGKRMTKKKISKTVKADEEISSCETYLRCGYDWYEKDVDRALDWMTRIEHGEKCFRRRFDTMKKNPLHCGLMKYDLYRSRQVGALSQSTNDNRDIWTMMFIYAAGRAAFPDSLSWPDMEFLLFQQDEKHVFFGGRPKNIEWTARKWLLALGRSSNDYTYKDLGHVKCCSARGYINFRKWRPLKDNSVLGRFISSRMNCCDVHHELAQDDFMEMVRTMHTPEALSRLARMLDLSQDEAGDFVRTWTSRLASWTLIDILELTQMYLAVDLADIGFDWAALDSVCSEMWNEASPLLIKHSSGRDDDDLPCDHEDCNLGTQPSTWTTVILSQVAEVEINLSEKKKRDPTVFAEELEKGSPAFMKLWSLIQAHCHKRVNTALGNGIFSRFAAEECLVNLLDTRYDTPYPARIVAPHVHKCFEGYPEDLAKQSTAMVLAKRVLASHRTLRVLKNAKSGV